MLASRRALKWLRYLFPLLGGALAGTLGVATYTTHTLNGMPRRRWIDGFTFSPYEVRAPHELVSFDTEDGITLRGWWLPRPETDRVVIGYTGHRGAKHELLGIGSGLWRAGSNVLLFDFRGCGDSDVAPLSVGYHELPDARAAARRAHRPARLLDGRGGRDPHRRERYGHPRRGRRFGLCHPVRCDPHAYRRGGCRRACCCPWPTW